MELPQIPKPHLDRNLPLQKAKLNTFFLKFVGRWFLPFEYLDARGAGRPGESPIYHNYSFCCFRTLFFCVHAAPRQGPPASGSKIGRTLLNCVKNHWFYSIFRAFGGQTLVYLYKMLVQHQGQTLSKQAPLIRTQEGVRSRNLAKLDVICAFCLSQSLPQSSDSKSWARLLGPQHAVNCDAL